MFCITIFKNRVMFVRSLLLKIYHHVLAVPKNEIYFQAIPDVQGRLPASEVSIRFQFWNFSTGSKKSEKLAWRFQADVWISWCLIQEVRFAHYIWQEISKHFVIQACISQIGKLKGNESKSLLTNHQTDSALVQLLWHQPLTLEA
jgi:hypothetical protein